jgi:hypothetical protein
MAAPAESGRLGLVAGVVLLAAGLLGVGVAGVWVATTDRDDSTTSTASRAVIMHGTQPPKLVANDIARASAALGIDAEPERIVGGWEAEDAVRSLYLIKSPSAWYFTFEDASILLEPAGDRAAICAAQDAPFACTIPNVELLADTAAEPPDAATAARAARRVLERAGLLVGEWSTFVLEPSLDVPPCRSDLETRFDCNRQVVPTRAVMLTRDFGAGTTAARFGIVIGPDGEVLRLTGRAAEEHSGS